MKPKDPLAILPAFAAIALAIVFATKADLPYLWDAFRDFPKSATLTGGIAACVASLFVLPRQVRWLRSHERRGRWWVVAASTIPTTSLATLFIVVATLLLSIFLRI